MAKINFTQEHFNKLSNLILKMLLNNDVITTKFGQQLNIVELLHTTTINTLNNIRISISKHIESLENQDEWVSSSQLQEELNKAKTNKELVNLLIGYKRYKLEVEENNRRKQELEAKIVEMKEATKTPEDRLKEAEAELAELNNIENF